jgi:hypothetical protein
MLAKSAVPGLLGLAAQSDSAARYPLAPLI